MRLGLGEILLIALLALIFLGPMFFKKRWCAWRQFLSRGGDGEDRTEVAAQSRLKEP